MTWHTYLVFLPTCFAMNMIFGPNNLLVLSNVARHGVAHTTVAGLGRLLAFTGMLVITGLGLAALIMASQLLFTVLKLCGAAYLIWLGIKLLRTKPSGLAPASTATPMTSSQDGLLLKHGKQEFYVAAGNPKAILILTAFLPQFVDRAHYAISFTLVGATFLVLESVAIVIYAIIGARLRWLTTQARGFVVLNRVSGTVMIAFGILLAVLRRPAQ